MEKKIKIPGICTDRPRLVTAVLLAALACLVCGIWYEVRTGLVFAAGFLAAGVLKPDCRFGPVRFLMNGAWAAVCIFLSCLIPTIMTAESSYLSIGAFRIAMNYLCVAVVYGLCLAATGRIRSAVVLASGLLLILAVINDFVFQFRGNLLKPTDILFLKTAMNVAGQYTFRLRAPMAYSLMLWGWMAFASQGLPEENWIPRNWLRVLAAVAAVGCAALFWRSARVIDMNTWSNEGITTNGYYLNFSVGFRDFSVAKPEGYSREDLSRLEASYPEAASAPEKAPNILVIMNESFADLRVLGDGLRTNVPVMPFLDSLEDNVIRGYALTSVFGGGTANAEYELLTGLSMANSPNGSPYQQHIRQPLFGLVHLMNSWGYRTVATHPYYSSGWNRTNVYNHLGFSEMTFLEDYPREDMIREYVSDREMYDYVLNKLNTKGDQPLFLFGITMQNHGDYIYTGDDFEQTVFLEGYERDYPMAGQFLSLIRESDEALEYLLRELEACPEDTVVLFFGDHLPKIESDFLEDVHGGPFETLEEKQLQYTVPFFLWANYDIEERWVDCTSLNYLGRYLLETAGLELPAFYRFQKDLEQVIPSLNGEGYYSVTAGTYLPVKEASGQEAQWISDYAALQYNTMFDKRNLSSRFFGSYLPAE